MSSTARNTVAVKTVQDIVDAVRNAAVNRKKLTAARQVNDAACQLDLSSMNAVVDYPVRDMTVTVEAGMSLRVFSDLVSTEGQQLPVDMADLGMTVGAFVAADLAGPRQYGYGTLRDYLIGMEAVDGQGRVFHAGGRVVKNVAGYDLCRLMVGSRGALGILSQLTFKLKPIPEQFLVQSWHFANKNAVAASLDSLNKSAARPVVIDVWSSDSLTWSVSVGVEGPPGVCDWQIRRLQEEITDAVSSEIHAADSTAAMKYCAEGARRHIAAETVGIVMTVPSQVVDVCSLLHESGLTAVSHAGNGIVVCCGESGLLPEDSVKQIWSLVGKYGGFFVDSTNATTSRRSWNPLSTGLVDVFDPGHVFV